MTRIVYLLALLGTTVAAATPAELDQARTAWRYRRSVDVPPSDGFASLELPPELRAHARPDLRDLRLLAADGSEVPYAVDRVVDREASRTWQGRLTDTFQEPVGPADEAAGTTSWTADLGALREFDTITLDVREQDFAKRVRVEGSSDAREWRTLADDAPVFDRAWQGRVRHTHVVIGGGTAARYLKLTMHDHRRSPPVTLVGVAASWTRRAPGEAWSLPAPVGPAAHGRGVTRYRVGLPAGLPIEELALDTDDQAFSRRIVLREIRGPEERVLADGWVYRVRLPEEALAGERLLLALSSGPGDGELVLEVHDGDSPPLRGLRLVASGTANRLLFAPSAAPVILYYGNDVTRPALYDLGPLRGRIATSQGLAAARLGAEEPNPAYQKPAPLPVGVLRGAAVDVSHWRAERPLQVGNSEDLYVATLAPEDLARLRPDLGDLRLVDDAGRQVPYILEPSAVEASVVLAAERMRSTDRVSRHRLLVSSVPERAGVPLGAIGLQFAEAFFDRPLRVRIDGDERRSRVLWSGRIERRPSPDAPDTEPIRLAWNPEAVRELTIEIEDGDNAPLALSSAEGFVRVPRLTFQAGAGAYRLLLGNPEASAPQYDLASLRREVLAYSAVGITLGASRANPAYRRYAGEFLKDAPPTLLLWGTLLATVAALLWLTMRVLRQPPAAPGAQEDKDHKDDGGAA